MRVKIRIEVEMEGSYVYPSEVRELLEVVERIKGKEKGE